MIYHQLMYIILLIYNSYILYMIIMVLLKYIHYVVNSKNRLNFDPNHHLRWFIGFSFTFLLLMFINYYLFCFMIILLIFLCFIDQIYLKGYDFMGFRSDIDKNRNNFVLKNLLINVFYLFSHLVVEEIVRSLLLLFYCLFSIFY